MKKFFRKTEFFTAHAATEPVELNSEWFPDYTGKTEQTFFAYIVRNHVELIKDLSLCEEARNSLLILVEGERVEYYNSKNSHYTENIQMGLPNKEWDKTGGFKTEMSATY
jgi:hypothetical protein